MLDRSSSFCDASPVATAAYQSRGSVSAVAGWVELGVGVSMGMGWGWRWFGVPSVGLSVVGGLHLGRKLPVPFREKAR